MTGHSTQTDAKSKRWAGTLKVISKLEMILGP
jgi:hypothetical protein